MANRPLYWTGSSIKEMTDDQLSHIRYELRKAFASDLYNASTGSPQQTYLYSGSQPNGNWTSASNIVNTYRLYTVVTKTEDTATSVDVVSNTTLASLQSTTTNFWYYNLNTDFPSLPSRLTYEKHGYISYNSTTTNLHVQTTFQNIFDYIIDIAIQEMIGTSSYVNDEIGSFKVATSQPGPGWVLKQSSFFIAREFESFNAPNYYTTGTTGLINSNKVWSLWIRTDSDLSERPDSDIQYPLGLHSTSSSLKQRSYTELITNILLPLFKYAIASNGIQYQLSTTAVTSGGKTKGTVINSTHPSGGNQIRNYSQNVYRAYYLPINTVYTTYYLNMIG